MLAVFAAVAALIGAAIDLVTVSISWEYFFYGKDLRITLGPTLPPDPLQLALGAARVGAASSWWAGGIVGLTLVLLNGRAGRSTRLATSLLQAPPILGAVVLGAFVGGVAGWFGIVPMTAAVAEVAASPLLRPQRYVSVYGAHFGAYLGAAAGLALMLSRCFRAR